MPARAQWRIQGGGEAPDTLVLPRSEPHISMGMGVLSSSRGGTRGYYYVAPNFTFRPGDRWTVNAGFGFMTDAWHSVNLNATPRSLAPYKHSSDGTRLFQGHVEASYRVSENVWLAAAVAHLGGTYSPVYGPLNGETMDMSVTAVSAAAAFRFADNNFLRLSFTFIRDHGGAMPFLMHDAWHGGYGMGCGASAFDYYRMMGPCTPQYGSFGGWNCW